MSEFHDNYPQYELMAHHSEEEGKVMRRKLWNVFWIMLGITILELIIGSFAKDWNLLDPELRTSTTFLKFIFIGLTLGKAYYIIYKFMHLEHENKGVKFAVIAPYTVFILYFVYILVAEANYVRIHKDPMDHLIEKQKNDLNEAAKLGHGAHETHGAGAAHESDAAHEGGAMHEGAATEATHESEKGTHEGKEAHH